MSETAAERTFKQLVMLLIQQGVYPSPAALERARGNSGARHSLNGRECNWRVEVLHDQGWKYVGLLPGRRFAWTPPRRISPVTCTEKNGQVTTLIFADGSRMNEREQYR